MSSVPGSAWRPSQPTSRTRGSLRRLSHPGKDGDGDDGQDTSGAKLLHSFAAHKAAINVARWNSLGKYILTAASDRAIALWNAAHGPPTIKLYNGHSHDVHALDIAHDNASFASGGDDRAVLVWDVAKGTVLRRFSQHVGRINDVRFVGPSQGTANGGAGSDNVLLAAGFDAVLRAYDLRSSDWRPIMEMKDAKDTITALGTSEAKGVLFAASADGVVRSYDVRKGELREDVFGKPIVSISPNRNGTFLLVSTLDSTHRILDLSDGSVLQTLRGHRNASNRCHAVFDARDESSVLGGDETGLLWKWDVLSGEGAPVKPDEVQSTKTAYGDRHRLKDASSSPVQDARAIKIAGEVAHSRAVLWTEASPTQGSTGQCLTAGADGVLKIWQL